jgi:NAD-dependent deacetylase
LPLASKVPPALREALRDARHVCVLTGAGISAESGVPTFREAQRGLWAQFRPEDLATRDAFLRDPALIWRWYRWRRELVAAAQPNAGHRALARLAGLVPRMTLITQNVDGLHQRAGSKDVIEFHGNLFADRCFVENCPIDCSDQTDVPSCPACGGHARPGVVWFGEAIPETALKQSISAAADCDVFLSIGTSALVYPAAGLVDVARQAAAVTVEVNPQPTELTASASFAIQAKAGSVLGELVDCLIT